MESIMKKTIFFLNYLRASCQPHEFLSVFLPSKAVPGLPYWSGSNSPVLCLVQHGPPAWSSRHMVHPL